MPDPAPDELRKNRRSSLEPFLLSPVSKSNEVENAGRVVGWARLFLLAQRSAPNAGRAAETDAETTDA